MLKSGIQMVHLKVNGSMVNVQDLENELVSHSVHHRTCKHTHSTHNAVNLQSDLKYWMFINLKGNSRAR